MELAVTNKGFQSGLGPLSHLGEGRVMNQFEQWPADFQQLLIDVWDDEVQQELPEFFKITKQPVVHYREQVLEDMDFWIFEDFVKGRQFIDDIINGKGNFPPLIVQGRMLKDGIHRVYAFLLTGVEYWDVIFLDQ